MREDKKNMVITPVLYKTLVVGVIVLFVGVGVQPAIALTDKEQNIKAEDNENVTYWRRGLIVDQVVDTICVFWGIIQIKSHMPFGQSFKPLYKRHYGIELCIQDMNPSFPLAPIQISLRKDTINGSFVPGTDVTLDLASGSGWKYFEFSSPVNLIINQTYVIDISTTTPRWGVNDTGGSCYTRGVIYVRGNPEPLGDLYFRTYVLDNSPPDRPEIDGPLKGKPGIEYEYTFNSTDLNEDPVMYIVEWGDGFTEWTEYCDSGEEIPLRHTWNEKGNYTIKAKAIDINGAESGWTYFVIEIPRARATSYLWFLKCFPLLERLLGWIR
jgi:hypothetical protein